MKVAAVILAHNVRLNGRDDLYRACWASLAGPEGANLADGHTVDTVDNGSTDDFFDDPHFHATYRNDGPNTTSGHGTNLCARVALGRDADICVLSDEDMWWRPGWASKLIGWWSEAPDDIWLTGCHLEPLYGWNAAHPVTETYGGVTGLIRNSTGAASWSFRAKDWAKIGPVPQKTQGWGDVPTCQRVRANGGRIAQIDLAEHRGLVSTWGNESSSFTQEQVAPVRAKLGA